MTATLIPETIIFGYGYNSVQDVLNNFTEYSGRLSRLDRELIISKMEKLSKKHAGSREGEQYRSLLYALASQVNKEYRSRIKKTN